MIILYLLRLWDMRSWEIFSLTIRNDFKYVDDFFNSQLMEGMGRRIEKKENYSYDAWGNGNVYIWS